MLWCSQTCELSSFPWGAGSCFPPVWLGLHPGCVAAAAPRVGTQRFPGAQLLCYHGFSCAGGGGNITKLDAFRGGFSFAGGGRVRGWPFSSRRTRCRSAASAVLTLPFLPGRLLPFLACGRCLQAARIASLKNPVLKSWQKFIF